MSLEMTPFDRSHMSSYWHSTVTMAIPCISSQLKPRYQSKIANFHTPPAFDSPIRGSLYCMIRFGMEKLEWCGARWLKSLMIH